MGLATTASMWRRMRAAFAATSARASRSRNLVVRQSPVGNRTCAGRTRRKRETIDRRSALACRLKQPTQTRDNAAARSSRAAAGVPSMRRRAVSSGGCLLLRIQNRNPELAAALLPVRNHSRPCRLPRGHKDARCDGLISWRLRRSPIHSVMLAEDRVSINESRYDSTRMPCCPEI